MHTLPVLAHLAFVLLVFLLFVANGRLFFFLVAAQGACLSQYNSMEESQMTVAALSHASQETPSFWYNLHMGEAKWQGIIDPFDI
jgi:hypothetical protein